MSAIQCFDCVKCDTGNECPVVDEQATKFDPKSRYYDVGGIEVQEVIKAKLTQVQYEGWCLGNMIKYTLRANWRGSFKRDIEKVGFYNDFLEHALAADRLMGDE